MRLLCVPAAPILPFSRWTVGVNFGLVFTVYWSSLHWMPCPSEEKAVNHDNSQKEAGPAARACASLKARLFGLASLLFMVWIIVSMPTIAYYEFQRKADCIRAEGWFRGWTWCSTDDGRGPATGSIVRGLLWPVRLVLPHRLDDSTHKAKSSTLTLEQREVIERRCAEMVAAQKRRAPDVPGVSYELCIKSQGLAALKGEPSFLTMTPDDFAYQQLNRELTAQEKESTIDIYTKQITICSQIISKAMLLQPHIEEQRLSGSVLTAEEVAAIIIHSNTALLRSIEKANMFHEVALLGHFHERGIYGITFDYFLTAHDDCIDLSAAGSGQSRNKDKRMQPITTLRNEHRATLMELFIATQELRDSVHVDE